MATQVQWRRGTTAEHSTFTGIVGEVTVDTTKDTLVVHDGITAGGIPLAKESGSSLSSVTLSDGTANGVAYLDSSKALTTGSALTFDGTNLGIGAGNLNLGNAYFLSGRNTANTGYVPIVKVAVGDILEFGSGGYTANFTGNLGIGTSSPDSFTLGSSGGAALRFSGGATIINAVAGDAFSTSNVGLYSGASSADNPAIFFQGGLRFATTTSAAGVTGFSEQMRLTSTGLGIGTSSPSAKLHVAGTALVTPNSGWTTNGVATQYFGDIYGSIKYDYNSTNFLISSYGSFSVATDGTSPSTKLTLTSSGNLGIGTTSPTKKLEVAGSDALIHGVTVGRGAGAVDTNTALGANALISNTTGSYTTASGYISLYSNTTGSYNAASGSYALYSNTTGSSNTASGHSALRNNTTGYDNTANGVGALYYNTTGLQNTASGLNALYYNTTGSQNTASGLQALCYNTTGSYNTASGHNALLSNTTGVQNTASGVNALLYNTTGNYNTASGTNALFSNTTGYSNTANGLGALFSNTTGGQNTTSGRAALYSNTTGNYNTAFGSEAGYLITTGSGNTIIGRYNGNQGGLDIRTANNYIVPDYGSRCVHNPSMAETAGSAGGPARSAPAPL